MRGTGQACTSLMYTDASGAPYPGRTMELPGQLPYAVAFFHAGASFSSRVDQHSALHYAAKHAFLSIKIPDPLTKDLKVVEGLNDQGLSFSVLAFASTQGPNDMLDKTQKILSAILVAGCCHSSRLSARSKWHSRHNPSWSPRCSRWV